MPVESATYISDLVPSNPIGATDPKSQGDDHIRLIKSAIKNTFPNITGAVTASQSQINLLTATTDDRLLRVTGGAANWGQLTSGMFPAAVVPDAALSSNVPRLNAPNMFTQNEAILIFAPEPRLSVWESDAPADNRLWKLGSSNGIFFITAGNDAQTSFHSWVEVTRSGSTIGTISLTGSAITLNGVNVADYARLSAVGDGLQVAGNGYAVNSTVVRTSGDQSISGTKTFTGTLALAGTISGNVSTPNSSASEVGFKGAPHLDITASTSTQASDAGGTIKMISGSGTLTLNANPPADSVIVIYNKSGNNWTITATGTLRWATTGGTGNRTLASGGLAVAYHDGNGEWVINGGGLS